MQIAIDGPAGAGKTSIAKAVSKKLDMMYLDTGAMYRVVGYKAIQKNIDTLDEKKVTDLVNEIDMDVVYKQGEQHMYLDDNDITAFIRTPEVSLNASNASKHKRVREKLVEMQRQIAQKIDVVMDGRDIGTYVLPTADYKFYITASVSVRAKRRCDQLKEKGVIKDLVELESEISARDYQDMNRLIAPLKPADDAIIIDTTSINLEQVLKIVFDKINYKGK